MAASGALANIDSATILNRYANGELMQSIADSLGVHHTSLYRDLLRDCPNEWAAHQAANSLAAYEQAVSDLDALKARDGPVSCTLAQARVKARQWELERLLKRIYGPSQEVTGKDGGPLQVEVVQFAGRVIEGEVGEVAVLPPPKP